MPAFNLAQSSEPPEAGSEEKKSDLNVCKSAQLIIMIFYAKNPIGDESVEGRLAGQNEIGDCSCFRFAESVTAREYFFARVGAGANFAEMKVEISILKSRRQFFKRGIFARAFS
uniref:Uncharacterized protein n=1 Tax=Romanomermis culicivorax TaxID=13658 RepID=A0A915L7U8_ROMCU